VQSRILSLASTHELLSKNSWCGASLEEIVQREFAPYAKDNIDIGGPSIALQRDAALTVSMVLHELATNAVKYGALSDRDGRVNVRWFWVPRKYSPDRLAIVWQEIGGPPASVPSGSGYGTSVIRELLPYELGGTLDLEFAQGGGRCQLEVFGVIKCGTELILYDTGWKQQDYLRMTGSEHWAPIGEQLKVLGFNAADDSCRLAQQQG